MNKQERIQEVALCFSQGDCDLGMRRLIDLGLECDQMDIFKSVLHYVDWHYSSEFRADLAPEIAGRSLDLINKTGSWIRKESADAVLELEGLCKSYKKGSFNLGPIDIRLPERGILGLVGQNGNGKTTLIRTIWGELSADSGVMKYHGNPVHQISYALKSKMAYIPQRTEIWYGSLMDNLQFTAALHGISPDENIWYTRMYIARFGLWPYKELNWKQLSGGYKMRFELARTMLRKPTLLLLDEPLANLDIVSQQLILEDLKHLAISDKHPMSIILSSQQLYEVEKISHEVLYLEEGKPKGQSRTDSESAPLVIELEGRVGKSELAQILQPLTPLQILFNGGVYIIHFSPEKTFSQVLKHLSENPVEITCIRNISQSSRRFFTR